MTLTPAQALDLTFEDRHDTGDTMSIRDYFRRQLSALWDEGESFSGKHPFGNSGWESVLQEPLVRAGCIGGTAIAYAWDDKTDQSVDVPFDKVKDFEADGYDVDVEVDGVDRREYENFIQLMIDAL